jgi:hypothetical protein
MRKA